MARPVVSDTAEAIYAGLGPWARGDGEDTDWALLHLIEAATLHLAAVDELARDSDDGPGWSAIVDLDRAPLRWLPWLAQFVGILNARATETSRLRIASATGWERGTLAAIKVAASRFLHPGEEPTITERADGDAYLLRVTIDRSQIGYITYQDMQDLYPSYGDFLTAVVTYNNLAGSDAAIESAILAAKPASLILDLVFTEAP